LTKPTFALKLTSKRQATLPATLCEELGVKPGDELQLERRILGGDAAWVIHAKEKPGMPWFGALSGYAAGKSHEMDTIRASIGREIGEKKS